jgi:hypothetical protein
MACECLSFTLFEVPKNNNYSPTLRKPLMRPLKNPLINNSPTIRKQLTNYFNSHSQTPFL